MSIFISFDNHCTNFYTSSLEKKPKQKENEEQRLDSLKQNRDWLVFDTTWHNSRPDWDSWR